jgi:hypothetical protein
MPTAGQNVVKSGKEIVDDFVDGLSAGESLDALTIASIKVLHKADTLTKTRLLQALDTDRPKMGSYTNLSQQPD